MFQKGGFFQNRRYCRKGEYFPTPIWPQTQKANYPQKGIFPQKVGNSQHQKKENWQMAEDSQKGLLLH
jgi:hypothetical protein